MQTSPVSKAMGGLFNWVRPKKKYVYGFNEGSLDDKSRDFILTYLLTISIKHTFIRRYFGDKGS